MSHATSTLPARESIPKEETWDVESVYADSAAWEADFARLDDLAAPLLSLRGTLTTPEALAQLFAAEDALGLLIDRLHLYAHMLEDQDTANGEHQSRMGKLRGREARLQGDLAWISPEILALPEQTLRHWLDLPIMAPYQRSLELYLRRKPHTLSSAEETLLGAASDIFHNPYEVFGKLTNADMTFPDADDAQGKKHPVTNGSYATLLRKSDRALRESAFGSIYSTYGAHKHSLTAALSGAIRTHVFTARMRHFDGALAASLHNDNIPATVYHSLIDATHRALPILHEYFDLRARLLKLSTLNAWDLHVPIVADATVEVDWAQTRTWITEALEPMGPAYTREAISSFSDRWYDVRETRGKRSGAYSTGAYGFKPFMLLNFHGSLDDVFTVAHELGHSLHTFYSQATQPYRYSGYPIFLAEIASTTNEALLQAHLTRTAKDPKFRAYLLNHLCDSFRTTVFRQTMFAEFELEVHQRIERGEALTAESVSEYYYGLNEKFHGARVKADPRIALEWLRIPHFYYNFYVYKYATGFAAAQVFARRIRESEEGREKYLGFLRSGGSQDPLDTVRTAGVDLSKPEVIEEAFVIFRESIRELERTLAEIGG